MENETKNKIKHNINIMYGNVKHFLVCFVWLSMFVVPAII